MKRWPLHPASRSLVLGWWSPRSTRPRCIPRPRPTADGPDASPGPDARAASTARTLTGCPLSARSLHSTATTPQPAAKAARRPPSLCPRRAPQRPADAAPPTRRPTPPHTHAPCPLAARSGPSSLHCLHSHRAALAVRRRSASLPSLSRPVAGRRWPPTLPTPLRHDQRRQSHWLLKGRGTLRPVAGRRWPSLAVALYDAHGARRRCWAQVAPRGGGLRPPSLSLPPSGWGCGERGG